MIRPSRACIGLFLSSVLAAGTAGCSGSASLSASEYRTRVAAICRDLRRRAGALPRPAGDSTDALVRAGRRALALQRDALGRIQALDAPRADEAAIGRWLDAVDAALDATAASLTAQSQGDFAAARAANARGRDATARADARARSLRVPDCTTPAGS